MIYQLTSIQENLILDDRETGLQCVEVSSKHVNLNMRRNPTGAAGAVIADAGVTLIRNVLTVNSVVVEQTSDIAREFNPDKAVTELNRAG